MSGPAVIVGGGVAGMVAALLLGKARIPGGVVLLDHQQAIGGLWRSYDYGADGQFDHGMHNIFECGVPEIDDLLFGLLPADAWSRLEGAKRDLAGLFYRGRLQTNSPSIDLRDVPEQERLLAEVKTAAQASNRAAPVTARDFALGHWGPAITDAFIAPILKRQFGKTIDELDPTALGLTAMSRVILMDEAPMLMAMQSDGLRARLAFPEQRNLPLHFSSGRKGVYPRVPGMKHVVDAVEKRLKEYGVEVLTGAAIASMEAENGEVARLRLGDGRALEPSALIWSAGLFGIAQMLAIDQMALDFERPRSVRIVNMLVPDHADMDGLHYIYCYEPDCASFRTTLYRNFADRARRPGGWPITMELLGVSAEAARETALSELRRFGVLDPATEPAFVAVENLPNALPMPTTGNVRGFATLRAMIAARKLSNLHIVGANAEHGLFFQGDVLRHVWGTIAPLIEGRA